MARRGGFLSRITNAIRSVFRGAPEPPRRPSPPPGRGAPPRGDRDRQRARERDPYLRSWDANTRGTRGNYFDHRTIIDTLAYSADLPEDERRELWQDYMRYMVGRKGERMSFRRNDPIRNPFWDKWGINPDNFDWQAWREAMGY
jgi:hypothetical protein